ncbi:Alpha/Beta hydrolase protein [Biscogniauxia sp. FL1348]|nr:Alpha/Beta hydrolase protein [Biscogniauxia sp. FL1348]
MTSLWSKQPFKAIYFALFLLKLPLLMTLYPVRYSLKQFRPLPEWSLRICLASAFVRECLEFVTTTRSSGFGIVQSGQLKAKQRFALAAPGNPSLYSGVLASGVSKPVPVGGLWYPGPIPHGSADVGRERVVIHFPGGAFVVASGSDTVGWHIASTMPRQLRASRTFIAQYRPAESADTRFPAAIQDLLTFYHYVLGLGVDPRNIVLSGDSAGGNLALALLRHLEAASQLPLPGGVMVWSPWTHVTADASRDYSQCNNHRGDMLVGSFLQWGADAYLPEQHSRETTPYISPLHHPFSTSVPVFLQAGTAEAFYDSVKSFASEMAGIPGNRIRLHSVDLAPHDLILTHELLGMTAQLQEAAEDAYNFFEKCRSSVC